MPAYSLDIMPKSHTSMATQTGSVAVFVLVVRATKGSLRARFRWGAILFKPSLMLSLTPSWASSFDLSTEPPMEAGRIFMSVYILFAQQVGDVDPQCHLNALQRI